MTKHANSLDRLIIEDDASRIPKDKGYVFRDFEVSRLQTLTETIQRRPYLSSLIFLTFQTFWTLALSYGAALFTDNDFAINLSPHLAVHTVVVGLLIFPIRMLWVPLAGFAALFFLPFYLPFTGQPQWLLSPDLGTDIVAYFFVSNLVASTLTGLSARMLFRRLIAQTAPRTADLAVTASLFGLNLLFFVPLIFVTDGLSALLAADRAVALGLGDHFARFGIERTLHGAVVDTAVLIAVLQLPTARQMKLAVPVLLGFPLIAILHNKGFGGFPMMDIGLLGILIALTLPAATVPIIIFTGMSIYVAMTGQFLHAAPPINTEKGLLDSYSIVVLILLVMIMAVRGRERYERSQYLASIRRLSTVRGFAGVGLFTLNVPRRKLRLDSAGQQLVGLPGETGIDNLLTRFRADERYLLRHAIESKSHASITLLLRLDETLSSGEPRVLRLHLWAEPTPRGEKVVYGLMVEVTEEHLQEQALTDALNELSLRQDRQKQLFSIVSHEIRTPASVLSMLIDDLENGHNSRQLQMQMREASGQLLNVLDDMRQAVNPEKNQPVTVALYTPADIAERVRNTYQLLAKGQNIRISLNLGSGASTPMMGDSNRLKQILGNLVRNAIIHSQGTEIRITYQPRNRPPVDFADKRMACWTVTDNGVGIPLEEIDRLFQPFERGSADARNQADGSGLGLYIAKQAVEMLGGEIAYFPAPEGGAGYGICLPDTAASPAELRTAAPKAPLALKDLNQLRVLLAEDNALVAQVTSKQLSRIFGQIDLAENGRVALEKILKNP
ncbi:MAG: hybrid sensor histidine kinase/response regulator, partial [Thalassovita sp.]|nr:hybrid sensor histidine kinase/response regulator [Thalassovita sp.]